MSDNVLDIRTQVDTGPLVQGMQQSAAVVEDSTSRMNAAYSDLTMQSMKAQDTQMRLKDALDQLGSAARTGNTSAMQILTASYRENIEETMKLASMKKVLIQALKEEAAAASGAAMAETEEAAAAEAVVPATEAATGSLLKMRMAAQLGARELGITLPRGFASIMARTPALQGALSAAFSVVAAVALVQIIAMIADKLSQLIADTFIYTAALKQMDAQNKASNTQILASVTTMKQEMSELFTMQHTGSQNIQKDLTENNAALEMANKSYREQRSQLAAAHVETDKLSASISKLSGATRETAVARATLGKSLDDSTVKVNALENSTGALKAKIDELGVHGQLLDEKLKLEKTREAQAAAKRDMKDLSTTWETEFLKMRQAEGQYGEVSKKQELEFWQSKLAAAQKFPGLYNQVLSKIVTLEKEIGLQGVEDYVAKIKTKIAATQSGSLERVNLEDQIVQYLKGIYGVDSKQYQDALTSKESAQRQYQDKMDKMAKKSLDDLIKDNASVINGQAKTNEALIAGEQQHLARAVQLHQVSDSDRVSREKDLENRLYKVKMDALQAKLELYKLDPDKNHDLIVRMQQDMENQTQQHENKINQITATAVNYRATLHAGLSSAIGSGFHNVVMDMMTDQSKLGQDFANVGKNMLGAFVSMLEQMFMQWVETHILMKIFGGTTNEGQIQSEAAVGAANAWASTAAIPIIGPELAPDAAAATFAGISALGSLAFFERGGLNPRDQLAYLHKDEMVLDKETKEQVLGGGGRQIIVQMPIQTMDSQSFSDSIDRHVSTVATKLKQYYRDGGK